MAVGETHGTVTEPVATPKGSNDGRGSTQIPFIELNPILYDQLSQFIAERDFAVVLLLAFNVFDYGIFVPVRDGEYAVTVLPMCKGREHVSRFDPFAGADLDVFDQVRRTDCRMYRGQDVQVVFDAIDAVEMALFVFEDAPSVAEQVFAVFGEQRGDALFGRKDDVIIDLRVGGHKWQSQVVRPFQGRSVFAWLFPWVKPTGQWPNQTRPRRGRTTIARPKSFDPFRVDQSLHGSFRGFAPTAIHVHPLRGW